MVRDPGSGVKGRTLMGNILWSPPGKKNIFIVPKYSKLGKQRATPSDPHLEPRVELRKCTFSLGE